MRTWRCKSFIFAFSLLISPACFERRIRTPCDNAVRTFGFCVLFVDLCDGAHLTFHVLVSVGVASSFLTTRKQNTYTISVTDDVHLTFSRSLRPGRWNCRHDDGDSPKSFTITVLVPSGIGRGIYTLTHECSKHDCEQPQRSWILDSVFSASPFFFFLFLRLAGRDFLQDRRVLPSWLYS